MLQVLPCAGSLAFEDLSAPAKRRALDCCREDCVLDGWYDATFSDADQVAELMGISISRTSVGTVGGSPLDVPAIHFSGFWSQGDGACFEGSFDPTPDALDEVKEYAPKDAELHEIARRLAAIPPRASARITHTGRYSHEHSVTIDVEIAEAESEFQQAAIDALFPEIETEIQDALRAFMCWIYARLEEDYENLTSDESVEETIIRNDYRFDEDGDLV